MALLRSILACCCLAMAGSIARAESIPTYQIAIEDFNDGATCLGSWAGSMQFRVPETLHFLADDEVSALDVGIVRAGPEVLAGSSKPFKLVRDSYSLAIEFIAEMNLLDTQVLGRFVTDISIEVNDGATFCLELSAGLNFQIIINRIPVAVVEIVASSSDSRNAGLIYKQHDDQSAFRIIVKRFEKPIVTFFSQEIFTLANMPAENVCMNCDTEEDLNRKILSLASFLSAADGGWRNGDIFDYLVSHGASLEIVRRYSSDLPGLVGPRLLRIDLGSNFDRLIFVNDGGVLKFLEEGMATYEP